MQKTAQHGPLGSSFLTPRETTNTSFATISLPTSMEHDKASNSRCSRRSRRYFFTTHIEGTPTENSPLQAHCFNMPSPVTLTNPFYPNSMNDYWRLPRKPPPDEQGDPPPPPAALAPAKVEEVPEDVRQNWHTALESFLKEYQSYPIAQNFEVNPSLLAALPSDWPLVRMTLNAKGASNRFQVSLGRIYYNDKLLGVSDNNALRTAHDQANELHSSSTVPRKSLRHAARTFVCDPQSRHASHRQSSGYMPF